jgi:UPF0755 protein
VIAIGLAGLGFWAWRSLQAPRAHPAGEKIITIAPGTGSSAVIAQLRREGLIGSGWSLRLWLRFAARGRSFKAGDYEFRSPIAPVEVLSKILRGEVATRHFTIPEGYNRFEIARVLAQLEGLRQPPPASPEALLPLLRNTSLIADLDPEAKDLEGYLFPDTYEYTSTTTRESLVEAMVRRFRRLYTPEMKAEAERMGMSLREVVTLASLIEKEAKVDAERELISQVFHRRLKMSMALGCDPTVIYAALLAGKYRGKIYRSDLDRDSPYNTYKYAGLPPAPSASPGRRSLQAALRPSSTDYLYFVVDVTKGDGSHKFSVSSSDHDRAVVELRRAEQAAGSEK